MKDKILDMIEKLVSVKSIVTLGLTAVLVYSMVKGTNPPQEILALYCTAYGSIITYFFTKENNK